MKRELVLIVIFSMLLFGASGCSTTAPEQIQEKEQAQEPSGGQEIQEQMQSNSQPESPACNRPFSPSMSAGPHYSGPLFDAHLHMPNIIDPSQVDTSKIEGHSNIPIMDRGAVYTNAELGRLLCNFEREKVRGAIGFTIGDEQLLDETVAGAKSMKARVGSKVKLFLSPVGFTASSLENIEASNKGLFEGYGELSFGFGSSMQSNQKPDDQNFLDIYKVAGKHNLVVMIHIGARQEREIENILQKNPDVTFLFHGPESENFIHDIIKKYPNAYYSIDAMLIRLPSSPGALMYTVSSKDEFKAKFSQNYGVMLDNTVEQWKSKIEQYPDRYMWGTDRSDPWTYDEDISAMIEEFSRDFIGRLAPAAQEKFAYKNAESIMG